MENRDYSQELGLWKCALNSPVESETFLCLSCRWNPLCILYRQFSIYIDLIYMLLISMVIFYT